jgi:divalent metal cation (Fe/Co/Zn/Cd) transporter
MQIPDDSLQGRPPDRTLTPEERRKETAVLIPNLVDCVLLVLFIAVAVGTGSLTMLSETIRGGLMLGAALYGYVVLRAVHRRRLDRFEFGVAKIEQAVSLLIGVGLLVSGLWVAQSVVASLTSAGQPPSPRGLAVAAVANAINTAANILGWVMLVASREGATEVYESQIRVRFTMMTSAIALQVTLTIAALAKDPGLVLLLDGLGATFVAGLMCINGVSMVSGALPDLLDAPARDAAAKAIRAVAAEALTADQILKVRTRRSGPTAFAEVTLRSGAVSSTEELASKRSEIEDALRTNGVDAEVLLLPSSV